MLRSKYWIVFVFVLLCAPVSAQKKSKAQLNREKQENLNRIKEAESILQQTTRKKKATLGQLNAINQQIRSRESLIRSINEEIDWYNSKISEDQQLVDALEEDVKNLKKEYAEMAYAGYKASHNQDKLTFLFSASSFNQFLIRLKYFEQYGEARRFQAEQIMKVEEVLQLEIAGYESLKREKEALLGEEVEQKDKLGNLKKQQNSLITDLSKKENQLRAELDNRKKAVASISKLIEDIIKEEMRALAANNAPNLELVSTNFAGNQRRLPWPVNDGFVSSGYGKHNHPVYKRVVIDNKGIYIQTKEKEAVKSVFGGTVSVVANIPGMNKAVIVQHGDYRTVYANLKDVNVAKGQEIGVNEVIGEVYTDNDGLSELYFEVWKKNSTLNPQLWLTKR